MIDTILNYHFLQYAILTAIFTSIVCGVIGVIIVEKKLVMMTGGIAHTSYGGIGLGYLLNFEPITGAFLFALIASIGIGFVGDKGGRNRDVVIGLMWSLGMAMGVVFIALTPGYPPNIGTYLFGSILSVTTIEFYMILALTVFILIIIIIFYQHWKLYIFDEEFAVVKGVNIKIMKYVLLGLVALTIIALIRVVGIILVMALLSAPAATATILSNDLKHRMMIASLLGIVYSLLGLYLAFILDISSGAAIAITAVVIFFFVYLGKIIKDAIIRKKYGKAHASN
jgi:zinc transport system permease protein